MKVYVKSRNRWEDYEWLPSRPTKKEPYEAAQGEKPRALPLAGGSYTVVLPELPSGRTDFCKRRIDDRLVVEGVSKPHADHLLGLYQQDLARLAGMVEARLYDNADNTQALSPALEEDIARLLAESPTAAAGGGEAAQGESPAASGDAAPPARLPRAEIVRLILRILLLLAGLYLYFAAYGG